MAACPWYAAAELVPYCSQVELSVKSVAMPLALGLLSHAQSALQPAHGTPESGYSGGYSTLTMPIQGMATRLHPWHYNGAWCPAVFPLSPYATIPQSVYKGHRHQHSRQ